MVTVSKQKVNLGQLPFFNGEYRQGKRVIEFHQDHWVEGFPRLRSTQRIADVLEMNLFLEHRYRGLFKPPKRVGRFNDGGGVSLLTLCSIANSLSVFLSWLEEHSVDWQEVIAQAATDKTKYWLPVYRFRKMLIDRVKEKNLNRDTANLYMNHVRQFYEWALKQRRIDKIPFDYKTRIIKKPRKDGDFDLLFSSFSEQRGIPVVTTDLLIPKKYKQKVFSHGELAPYSRHELELLYASAELQKPTQRLWVELAHLCGLRADEVATFKTKGIENPEFTHQTLFYLDVEGKFSKTRKVMISRQLMTSLWEQLNNSERIQRLAKWQLAHGDIEHAPLFLNRSGKGILAKSVSNVIAKVRQSLNDGESLERDFHDLRSTFATNLTTFMLKKNLPIGFIQYKLMQLLGHSNFSTTMKYINFARSETFDRQMASWVDKLFGDHLETLHKDMLAFNGEVMND